MAQGSSGADSAPEGITVKSRAAELLMHSRRFEDMNLRLHGSLVKAGIIQTDPPNAPQEAKAAADDDRLPSILTDAVCNNSRNLTNYESLIEKIEIELL